MTEEGSNPAGVFYSGAILKMVLQLLENIFVNPYLLYI